MLIKRKSKQSSQPSPPPPPPPPGFPGEEESGFESKLNVLEKCIAAKRPARDAAAKDAKKSKKIHNVHYRLWSEEDEIVILKGLIDYAAEKKSDPYLQLDAFHDFIRGNLHVDATKLQLRCKIRKMRLKYESNSGKRTTFSKPHFEKIHHLSKLIWGKGGDGGGKSVVVAAATESASEKVNAAADSAPEKDAAGKNVDAAAAEEESEQGKDAAAVESEEGEKLTTAAKVVMSMEERMLIAGREVYEIGEERVEGEEEWRKLRVEELELYQKELEVRAAKSKVRIEQTKLVLDAINRGKVSFF